MEDPNICTGEPVVESSGNWRSELQPDSRQRHVDTIMETLKRHLPVSGDEGLRELKKIAERFEEKGYTSATSESDYLRKISLKMLTMETESQNPPMGNSLPSNSMVQLCSSLDSTSQSMQSQVFNQRQSMLSMAMPSNRPQHSSSLPSAVSPVAGLASASMPNIVSTVRNVSGVPPSSVGSSMDQGAPSNVFSQQQLQQQQSPTQKQPILLHQLKQQNIMPQNQLQSSQQPVLQTSSVSQPSLSNLQQNQQSPIQLPYQSMLQQPPQPFLRQHQQHPFLHLPTMPQQTNLTSQQQQQLISQLKFPNMQQNQLTGQQNSVGDMQQQSNLSNMLIPPSQLQYPFMAQLSILSNLQQQQQLGPQSIVSGLQQQQMHGTQSGNSNLQSNQHSAHMLQPNTVQMQQPPQNTSNLLSTQGQQGQLQSSQQLMCQIPLQSTQVQQQVPLPQQQQPTNTMSDDLQQRLEAGDQAPSSLLQTQNVMDQPKQLYPAQSALPETSSTSLDTTAQTGQANGGDWQEEIYQKIKAMKDLYYIELREMHQKILPKLHQFDSNPQQPKSEQLNKLRAFKGILERLLSFLQVQKSSIDMGFKDKISHYERQIVSFFNSNRPRNSVTTLQAGQFPDLHMQSLQQLQSPENEIDSQLHSANMQGSVAPVQQNDMQHNSLSTFSGSAPQQKMMFPMQPSSNLESGQRNSLSSLQQAVAGSLQQNSANNSSLPSQNGVNALQQNMSSLQSNPNMLQHQHLQQQDPQQLMQSQQHQQLKQQLHQRQIQQMKQQQFLQQQQLQQSQLQQPLKLQPLQQLLQSQQQSLKQKLQSLQQVLPSQQQQLKHQRHNHLLMQQLLQQSQSVVSMIDILTGSASGNGSRAAVLEDLDAMTEGRLQARNFGLHDGPNGTKKLRRCTSEMPLNVVSSAGSVDDVFKPLTGADTSDLKSPATSSVKRTRVEAQDWRSQLQPESRQQIIEKIMEILETHFPVVGHEGLIELRKMVETFENEIYITAVNQILQSLKIED